MIETMFHYHFTQEKNYYNRLVVYHDNHLASIEHDGLSPGETFDGKLEADTGEGAPEQP